MMKPTRCSVNYPGFARRAARSFLGGEVVDFRGEVYCRIEGEFTPKTGEYNYFYHRLMKNVNSLRKFQRNDNPVNENGQICSCIG